MPTVTERQKVYVVLSGNAVSKVCETLDDAMMRGEGSSEPHPEKWDEHNAHGRCWTMGEFAICEEEVLAHHEVLASRAKSIFLRMGVELGVANVYQLDTEELLEKMKSALWSLLERLRKAENFASKCERGEASFKTAVDAETLAIAGILNDEKKPNERLSETVQRLLDSEVREELRLHQVKLKHVGEEAREFQRLAAEAQKEVVGLKAIVADLEQKLKAANKKNESSLANNLCPDHRDKQQGKPCLACEIERLERLLTKLQSGKSDE